MIIRDASKSDGAYRTTSCRAAGRGLSIRGPSSILRIGPRPVGGSRHRPEPPRVAEGLQAAYTGMLVQGGSGSFILLHQILPRRRKDLERRLLCIFLLLTEP